MIAISGHFESPSGGILLTEMREICCSIYIIFIDSFCST